MRTISAKAGNKIHHLIRMLCLLLIKFVFKSTDKLKKLTIDFYKRKNVVMIARDLLGKIITTNFDGMITSARIVETEAYIGNTDKASHAYGGRRTARNEHMYAEAATSYVYICYGIHQMFNVVTNDKEIPDAVLIRAVEPLEGIDTMLARTGKKKPDSTLTKGPGNVGKALGIYKMHSGLNLLDDTIYISSDGYIINENQIGISKRIGVHYAGPDALLPYRFFIKGNKYVSGRPVL
jgi:DNA-3-methyladenine glycosylase